MNYKKNFELAVFVGPSLVKKEKEILSSMCHVFPPARWGDFDSLDRKIKDVIFIDGVMVNDHPPSIKECYRLSTRANITGTASLGALRAVELKTINGVGWVYEAYKNRSVTADDEVLVSVDSSYGALTIPLVNLRFMLDWMDKNNYITKEKSFEVIEEIKNIHFSERTISCVKSIFKRYNVVNAPFERMEAFDIKRKDSLNALTLNGIRF